MNSNPFDQLADHLVLRGTTEAFSLADASEGRGIAGLAVIDARKLYLPAAHSSLYSYCVHELGMSEDIAYKRIRVARLGMQFPVILPALADGRLSLSAVLMLSPHLAQDTADELVAAAAHKTNAQLSKLIAQRFPRPDVPSTVRPLAQGGERGTNLDSAAALATTSALAFDKAPSDTLVGPASNTQLAARRVGVTEPQHAPPAAPPTSPTPRPKVAPLAPERYAVQLTIGQETHDKLRYAQALLGHALPSGDLAGVLDRALDALIRTLETRKIGAGSKSARATRRREPNERFIPAAIRRAVWQRDGGQCTFTSDKGKRCESRMRLEFDHVEPVARGGLATATNLRLRCRAHNQYAASQVLGARFMQHKREVARRASDTAAQTSARVTGTVSVPAVEKSHDLRLRDAT